MTDQNVMRHGGALDRLDFGLLRGCCTCRVPFPRMYNCTPTNHYNSSIRPAPSSCLRVLNERLDIPFTSNMGAYQLG